MEALALLDIDQEDDNLLIASSPEENESNAEEEPLLILSVSPPSPSLVSCKKKRLEALGDLQNCRGSEVGDPPGRIIATCKNPDDSRIIAASDSISVLSALDLNAINNANTLVPYDHGRDAIGMSKKAQCAKGLMKEDGTMSAMSSVSKGTCAPTAGSYIHSARQQRHEISSPEKIEEEPVVLRRNRSRRLMTLRKSLAWDKAFFTDEDKVSSPLAGLQVPTNSTEAHPSSSSRAVEQMQRTSLSAIPRASPKPLKQAPGIKSNSETVMPKAATKSQVKEPGVIVTHHQVRSAIMKKATDAAAKMDKKVEEKIGANGRQNGNQEIIMHSMSTPALSPNGSLLSHKVSSISKKVKDALGKVIPGQGPITSAVHSQQHVHTSGKPFAVPKRPRGLPTVPAVKDPIKRVDSSAVFGSDTTIKGVFNVRNLFHAKDTSSATCTASKMQVHSIPRSKSATPPPGLVKCLPGSIQDAMLPPAEAFHTGKPSGLRKPSPKLGFFDSAQALAGPQLLSTTCQQLSDARQAFQMRGPANHSSIGMHSRTPSKDTGGSNSHLQGLFLGKGRSPISYAPHLQSDVASVPATPRACLTSPATPQGSSSKSTRLPMRKGLPGYKNCSGSVYRELMSETLQLNAKRPQSDISDSKTVNMAMQATDCSLKLPNAQFNKLDRPDFESANDILCLPEPHHAQSSALCAECDAKCLQCRIIPETEGVDCGSVQTIFSLQLPEGDVTLSGDHGADSKKEALAACYCVQDSDLETGGDCSSVQTTFSLQLPEGDITPSGDHGADSNEEALAASYCVQDSDHELKIEGGDCDSVQTIFSLQLPEGDITPSGDRGADSNKEALASSYCVQDSDHELKIEGGDCDSVQTILSLQLPEGDITASGDRGPDSNKEALASSYCVQDSDHELKIEGGDCDSVQTIFSLQLPEGDITASDDRGADSNKEALASSYCVQDSDHELETWGSDCGSLQTVFNLRLPEGEITQRVVHGAFSNKEIVTVSYCVQDSEHELETDEGDCGSVKMDFSISLSKRDVSPRGDYGDDSNEDVLANYFVQDPNHELEIEGGDCGNVKTIFRLSLSEGDISQRGDRGANSNMDDLAASFCVKDSDNELETDEGDCVNVKTGFSLSLSEKDISGRCDHGTESKKAALAASYCVPDLNHELETEGGDGSNVRTVFPLTFSENDISPRGDYGTESNKEILTAGDCVQDSDCEPSGGQSNSCGAVLMLPISLSPGNIASAQNCGSEQVETSGSSGHALQKQALAWMARSDCLQSSESIQSVLLLSPHDNLLEAPTEPGSASAVEARESSLLQVSMKTTDLSELLEFSAIILCTQISGDDKDQTEETEVTSLPSRMTPVIASSLESTPQAGCDQRQKLDCQQSCFAASESIPTLPAAGTCFNNTRCLQYEQSNSLSSKDFVEASPKHCTPPVTKESFCQKFGIKHSWQYNSPTSKGFSEASATPNSLPAPNRYAQNSGYKKHWHSSLPGTRIGAGVPPTVTTLTPVLGRYGSLLGCNDPADATVTSSLIEANSGLLLFFEQHRDAHTAINATGSSDSSPKNAERKTLDSPLSQWSDWPILQASIPDDLKQSDDTTLLKYQALRPPTEQERGLICDRSPLENDSLTRMPAQKAVPVETDGASNWSPLAGPNVSNACSLNIKEKGSVLSYARKAVSQLTSSPMSANAGGQESFGTLITCKSQQSRTPGKTCLADSKPPSPFSEERICALEAAGKESLQVKSGPVKHSPPEKIDPEPNPWSPVRKNGRQLGPFDCTKLKYINPGLPI
ncbi:hypothetical protein BDL97_10G007700 [Sphagnum fallax]|nr:hypothetical protein BDL97_10G007700 [Sphagnum fallax]